MENIKKRYKFIDLLKGISILLIVAGHLDLPGLYYPSFSLFIVPLFYFCSGFFFQKHETFLTLFTKKVNSLLVPYLFFSIPSIFVYLLGLPTKLYNGPIWFLFSLFCIELVFYFLLKINNNSIIISIIATLSFLGWLLCQYHIVLPFFGTTVLCGIPFFSIAFLLRQFKIIFEDNKFLYIKLCITIILWCVITINLVPGKELGIISSDIPYPFFLYIILGLLGSLILFYIAKIINYIPGINYFGQYSIIILCTHWYFIKIWQYFIPYQIMRQWWFLWLIFLFAITISIPTIYFFKKYLPWFCAQKPIFKLKTQKL